MRLFNIKVAKIKDVSIILPFLLRVFIDIIYIRFVVGNYAGYGFKLDFSISRYIISLCITFIYSLIAGWVFIRKDFYSNCFYLLILLYFIPGETVISFNSTMDYYHMYVLLYFIVSFSLYYAFRKIDRYNSISAGLLFGRKLFLLSFLFLSLVLLNLSYKWAGLRMFISIEDVYSYRINARSFSIPSVLSYLRSWASVILSILFVYFAINKNYFLCIIILLLHFLDYGFDGQKIILFRLFLEIVIAFFYNDTTRHYIPHCIAGVSFISAFECIIRGSSLIGDYIIRRIMILPTLLGSYAFDFFSRFEPDYLRSSFLRHFGYTSPYYSAGGIPRTLGYVYFNSNEMAADVGLAGDAFSQFGWFGLFLSPILISFSFWIMSRFSDRVDKRIVFLASVFFTLIFIDTSFFTIMLTNGFLVVMLMLLLINRSKATSIDNNLRFLNETN